VATAEVAAHADSMWRVETRSVLPCSVLQASSLSGVTTTETWWTPCATTKQSCCSSDYPGVSYRAKHLVLSMLRVNPSQRPSMERVLCHPWLHHLLGDVLQGMGDLFKPSLMRPKTAAPLRPSGGSTRAQARGPHQGSAGAPWDCGWC